MDAIVDFRSVGKKAGKQKSEVTDLNRYTANVF